MHALQALDSLVRAALLAILSISRQALHRCLDEIPPQQTVDDVGSHRATLQLSENILATGMAMDTFIGVELLQLLRRSLQPTMQVGTISEDAVLFKIPLLKLKGRQLLHVMPVLKICLRSRKYSTVPIFGHRHESIPL